MTKKKDQGLSHSEAAVKFNWPKSGVPRSGEITVNYACNAKCLFCYNPMYAQELQSKEVPFKRVAEILYTNVKKGYWVAYLIGGEPTVRDDLPKIVSLARKIGFPCVQIMTNGILLADKNYARLLVESGANLFRVSIHGPDEKTHDRMVDVPGAFKKTIKAIKNLKKLGVQVGVNFVITALNYKSFPRFMEMMLLRFGVRHFCIVHGHYRGVMEVNRELLKIQMTETAPYIRDGLEVFKARNIQIVERMLSNFTPCVLPGYEHLMAEWYYLKPEKDDLLYIPEGDRGGVCDMKAKQRMKAGSCRRCVYNDRCMGFEKEYFELFGDREFVPLLKKPKPFPLVPIYK